MQMHFKDVDWQCKRQTRKQNKRCQSNENEANADSNRWSNKPDAASPSAWGNKNISRDARCEKLMKMQMENDV